MLPAAAFGAPVALTRRGVQNCLRDRYLFTFLPRTLFRYRCPCGRVNCLEVTPDSVRCPECACSFALSPPGIIHFFTGSSEQNEHFDRLYGAGHGSRLDEVSHGANSAYDNCVEAAGSYLKVCGIDPGTPVCGLSILDVACGAGWVTAGLFLNPNVRDCQLHASDISPHGLHLLGDVTARAKVSNRLEMSVQNAESMMFGDASFDVIIGSSMLHHLNDYERFLGDCRRILKPAGVATFGEPFAVGYGIGVGALKLASQRLGIRYQALDALHKDILCRIRADKELIPVLVDKHLFLHSAFLAAAQRAGFCDVQFVPRVSRDYHRTHFITDLLNGIGISDDALAAEATGIYQTMFEVFDADSFGLSVAHFIQIVLRA